MSDVQTAEFLRLIKVSFDISLNALKAYANEKLIKPSYGDSLIRFLDKKKHFFYHKWQSKLSCCKCSTFVSQKKELHDWIFYKLYAIEPGIKCNSQSNLSQVNGVQHQHCLCRIISHQNLSLNDLDVSVICFLLKNCGHSNLLINQIDDIAKVRNILCHQEKGSKSFSKAEYGEMWKTLENSILSLAKEIGVFYWESVKDHLATIKKHGVDLDDVIHHLKDIKEFNTKMKQEATDHMQKVNDSILSVQAELTAKEEEQTLEIQRSISESTANVLDGQQDILEKVRVIQTAVNYNASEMNKVTSEGRTHETKEADRIIHETGKETKEICLSMKNEIVDEFKTVIRMLVRELKIEPDNSSETEAERKIKVSSQVNSKVWNKKKTVENLKEIAKTEMKDDDPDNFHIDTAEEKCIQLELTAHPDVFQSAEKLRSAIIKLNRRLLEAGEVDTYKAGTMTIDLIVNTPLTEEEKAVVYKLFTESGSSENAFDTKDVKSNLTTIWKEDISLGDTTFTHDNMDVNITDVLGKMVKKEAVQTYAEDFEIEVDGIKFSVTFKGLPHSLKTTNDDDTVPNEKTDYCFLGWTWVCPKQWNLPKMVSVLNTELLDSSDWFQIHFAYVGVNGQLEIQTRTQEHVFRQRLGLESAVLRFLGKIVEACDLEQSYSEEVSVSVVFHSGTIEVSDLDKMKYEHVSTSFGKKEMTFSTLQCKSCGDRFPCENCKNYVNTIHQLLKILRVKEYEIERLTFGEQPEKAIEKRKDSDNDEEKEWETSSVDCQEPELKKRKIYTEDLTGDHQSEKVTTDLTSTGDSEISFDINETLKKLGKLKLIDLKINEGEEQKRKLRPRHQSFLNYVEGTIWYKHVVDILEDLKMRWKCRFSVSDNLLEELSYQRKQNAAGTEDLDFLDKNFGLQCNFCMTQNKDDIPGRCKTCSEILCNKCLVQHHVDHSDHLYNYADDILHGYEKTTYSFSVENALVDIKCLTIDTLVIVHMHRLLGPLTLSIYDLTGNHLTTKQTSYGGISDAKITVIDPTTVAVSIPSDAVLIANYINPIINMKEIKTSPGMTGGIASINNKLYLAYKTEIKVFTLAGEEITSIDIPDITLLYTVSNCRLLCVCNRKCCQSKTMGYIDIMNNSMLPLDKLPFHPDDVAVDNEGNILFVKDDVVWQAKADGSDCKVIISENWEHYKRVCFNAYSNLLVVGGSYRGMWVFRKLGDE